MLTASEVAGRGIRRSSVGRGVRITFRRGGERCHPAGRARSQTLKHALQERGVAPWQRARLPLLYRGGELVAVAGLLVCEGFQAGPGEAGYVPEWQPVADR